MNLTTKKAALYDQGAETKETESMADQEFMCPHCDQKMRKWQSPDDSNWGGEIKYVCFYDECPYYVRGWVWMEEQYGTKSSYRHSISPDTGASAPLPVASPDHMKPGIVD